MKKVFSALFITAILLASNSAFAQKVNQLSNKEKKAGWELLFNGNNFDGWRQYNGNAMPANWTIEDNSMKVFLGEGKQPGQGANGDILFGNKKYKNFELSIDWKASEMANSGIFLLCKGSSGQTYLLFGSRNSGTRQ
jgi:hypothetical protein